MIDMPMVKRRITYKLYPSAAQAAALEQQCVLLCRLRNAALEERIECYRKTGKSINFADQCRSLTQVRAENPEYATIHTHAAQVVLKRLQRAFENFFGRIKSGARAPGFPRFQSKDRFPGFGYKEHGNGFRFTPKLDKDGNWKHGTLYLAGVGKMTARGEARTVGQKICECSILRKCDGWYLSLVVECMPYREHGEAEAGLDWGVETLATLAYENEDTGEIAFEAVPNGRLWQDAADAIKAAQRDLSKTLRDKKRSKRSMRRKRALAKRARRLANRRKNRNHQTSADLVRDHALIVTEVLSVKNMTGSAKGTIEVAGSKVAQKAGLNREILDTAPSSLLKMTLYKAEEAGGELILLSARKYKPSQTCPACLVVKKKSLSVRGHRCGCGFSATRDQASALHCLRVGRILSGREPTRAVRKVVA
jgi:putative transposase